MAISTFRWGRVWHNYHSGQYNREQNVSYRLFIVSTVLSIPRSRVQISHSDNLSHLSEVWTVMMKHSVMIIIYKKVECVSFQLMNNKLNVSLITEYLEYAALRIRESLNVREGLIIL